MHHKTLLMCCLLLGTGCTINNDTDTAQPASVTDTNLQTNKEVVMEMLAIFNERRIDDLDQIVATDFIKHGMPGRGPEVVAQTIQMLTGTFPDLQIEARKMMAEGDLVSVLIHGQGTQSEAFMGNSSKGRSVTINSMDIFRLENSKIVEQWIVADQLGMLQQITGPQPDSGDKKLLKVELVSPFDAPVFLESVLADKDGALFVTSLFESKIYRIGSDGRRSLFFEAALGQGPALRGVFCLVAAPDGGLFVTINSPDPGQHGLWYINRDGEGKLFSPLPLDSIPNGIARLDDKTLLVADSGAGKIWRVNSINGEVSLWLNHALIAPRPFIGQFPGANGIQIHNNTVYVSNSDQNYIVSIPVSEDDTAGKPQVFLENMGADDFAIAADGTFYLTTHPYNTVVQVTPDGSRRTIASPDNGIIGPTAAYIHHNNGTPILYIVTDGGFYTLPADAPRPIAEQQPGVFRIRL